MHKLDARGRVCPLPLFYTKSWSREHGHEIVKVEESGSDFRVIIRKH